MAALSLSIFLCAIVVIHYPDSQSSRWTHCCAQRCGFQGSDFKARLGRARARASADETHRPDASGVLLLAPGNDGPNGHGEAKQELSEGGLAGLRSPDKSRGGDQFALAAQARHACACYCLEDASWAAFSSFARLMM
jgi:hypothetical protein